MMAHVWNRSTFPALQEVFCSLFSQHSKIWPRPLHPYLCSTLGLQGLWGESPFHQRSLSNLKLWRWNCQHDKEEWSFPGLECKGLTSPLSLVPFPFSCYIESWSVSHWMSIESPAGRTRPRNSFNFSVSYLTGKHKFRCPVFFFWQLYFLFGVEAMYDACLSIWHATGGRWQHNVRSWPCCPLCFFQSTLHSTPLVVGSSRQF